MVTTGRCNCAGITVSIPALPKESAICYCSNCRRGGGSMGSIVYIFDKEEVSLIDPKNNLKTYTDSDTTSGHTIYRKFCGNCGCPIMSLLEKDAPKWILKGGLFDSEPIPIPTYKSFEQDEPKWLKIVENN